MSYSLEIRPEALADIEDAAKWYEEREPGLGPEFVRTIREAIGNLPANPFLRISIQFSCLVAATCLRRCR